MGHRFFTLALALVALGASACPDVSLPPDLSPSHCDEPSASDIHPSSFILHPSTVTIYRDRWGIPSIVAQSFPDAAYGLGYAMAQDDAERMALNFKQARGRMAEVEGRGQ